METRQTGEAAHGVTLPDLRAGTPRRCLPDTRPVAMLVGGPVAKGSVPRVGGNVVSERMPKKRAARGVSRRRAFQTAAGAGAALLGAQLLAQGGQAAGPVRGHLDPGGHVVTYPLSYPGDMSVYTIGLQVSTDNPAVLRNVGFKVFGPQNGKTYVTGGARPNLRPNVSGNLISADKGPYTIQVYSYDPFTPIDFELSVGGNAPEGRQLAGSTP